MTFAVVCAIDETDVKLLSSKPAAILYALAIRSVPVLHYTQVTTALIPLQLLCYCMCGEVFLSVKQKRSII